MSIRDLLAWVSFINTVVEKQPSRDQQQQAAAGCDFDRRVSSAYVHGACLVFLDALSSESVIGGGGGGDGSSNARQTCMDFLNRQIRQLVGSDVSADLIGAEGSASAQRVIKRTEEQFGIEPFYIAAGGYEYIVHNSPCATTYMYVRI